MIEKYNGMSYTLPKVYLLADSGIGNAEFAARTCYNSFDSSEHTSIQDMDSMIQSEYPNDLMLSEYISQAKDIDNSELLKQLSFVHFHHSVLEHNVVTFFIKGISRGVLQELARHRIASYSVKSTRYTLDDLMYNFIVSYFQIDDAYSKEHFVNNSLKLDLFVTSDKIYNSIELSGIFDKLKCHFENGEMSKIEFLELIVPKSNIDEFLKCDSDESAFEVLYRKKKRNVGDAFKHIITDNFKTDVTMTINLRSLKNFFDLRLSGAAWFQIRWLANEMKKVLPEHCKSLIFKSN